MCIQLATAHAQEVPTDSHNDDIIGVRCKRQERLMVPSVGLDECCSVAMALRAQQNWLHLLELLNSHLVSAVQLAEDIFINPGVLWVSAAAHLWPQLARQGFSAGLQLSKQLRGDRDVVTPTAHSMSMGVGSDARRQVCSP